MFYFFICLAIIRLVMIIMAAGITFVVVSHIQRTTITDNNTETNDKYNSNTQLTANLY